MKPLQYTAVATIDEAVGILHSGGDSGKVIAGGTDLMIEFRRPSVLRPDILLDISRIAEIGGIREAGETIVVGPMATHRILQQSGLIRQAAPLLAGAASTVGSPQIRNRGTVGGNIMNAAACADTVPPLIALDAIVTLRSSTGARDLPLADLFIKPYRTHARPDELLVAITFRRLSLEHRSAFIKLGRRNALAISRLSVAAVLKTGSDGRITDARIVPGAAFPAWRRVKEAETMLIGEKPSEKLFAAAGAKVSEAMIAETGRRWSTEYKEPVIGVLVRRALTACTGTTPQLPSVRTSSSVSAVPVPRKLASRADTGACTISFMLNGRKETLSVSSDRTLLAILRDDLGLTGTKCGCEVGECGACTVILDGQAVNSCLVPAPQIDGRSITTIEGLAQGGNLHPLQESFLDHDAAHCGFCTPGMLMSAKALLDETPKPTEQEIRTAISGNLCRCTGYVQIVDAIATSPEHSMPESQTSHH
jgi:xanthine dehydrogenase iron-sulfur cluster and FAD-binding subunit A